MKHRLSCIDFIESGLPNDGCCDSCHDDDNDWGYDMVYLEPMRRTNTEAHICCEIATAIDCADMPLRKIFALALRAHRKRRHHESLLP